MYCFSFSCSWSSFCLWNLSICWLLLPGNRNFLFKSWSVVFRFFFTINLLIIIWFWFKWFLWIFVWNLIMFISRFLFFFVFFNIFQCQTNVFVSFLDFFAFHLTCFFFLPWSLALPSSSPSSSARLFSRSLSADSVNFVDGDFSPCFGAFFFVFQLPISWKCSFKRNVFWLC